MINMENPWAEISQEQYQKIYDSLVNYLKLSDGETLKFHVINGKAILKAEKREDGFWHHFKRK